MTAPESAPPNLRVWLTAIRATRDLPKSAKLYADWLIGRRIKSGVYKGGQQVAAQQLGMAVTTVSRAENALVARGYLELIKRGNHIAKAYSQFSPRMPKQNVDQAHPRPDQHPVGAVLIKLDQHPVVSRSLTNSRYDFTQRPGPIRRRRELPIEIVIRADIATVGSRRSRAKREPGDVLSYRANTSKSESAHHEAQPRLQATDRARETEQAASELDRKPSDDVACA